MRRTAAHLLAALAIATPLAQSAFPAPARAQTTATPHAFLFGAWTGGLFPPPSVVSARTCLAQPSVIFTRDVVMRATLTDVLYIQRMIETARGTGNGVDIQLIPAQPQPGQALLAAAAPGQGFGCETPDALHVQRLTNDEIRFPGCKDFPFPLVRCPAS